MNAVRSVTVATDLSHVCSRHFLAGVLEYARARADWRLKVLTSRDELTEDVLREIETVPGAGLIATELPSPDVADVLTHTTYPLVLVGTRADPLPDRRTNTVVLTIDESAIGRRAAEHLLSFGRVRSSVFLPMEMPEADVLSSRREAAFARYCTAANVPPHSFRGVRSDELAARLAALPRPIAVLAESAARGQQILQAASAIGLDIPGQCVLVVIESDLLFCTAMTPQLTSVFPDAKDEGVAAARQLDALLKQRRPSARRTLQMDVPLICQGRETTAELAPTAELLRRADELIAREAVRYRSAGDLARRLGVSRRLLDLRFVASRRQTVAAALREARLAAFAGRLVESKLAVERLAITCGFPNASYLKTLFKRHYGMTPGAYRRAHAELKSPR